MDPQLYNNQTTAFAFNLLKELYLPGQNLVFSPYSLLTVLTMAMIGARGSSRQQLINVLFNPNSTDSSSVDRYAAVMIDEYYLNLEVANLLYADSGIRLKPEFVSDIWGKFGAIARNLDFIGKNRAALAIINSDVSKATSGMIPELFSFISSDSKLFLVNAIYFKENWKKQFDQNWASRNLPNWLNFWQNSGEFRLYPNGRVKAILMTQRSGFMYFEDQQTGMKAIDLEYKRASMSMIVILPPIDMSLNRFLRQQLNLTLFKRIMSELFWANEVRLVLPRFEISSGRHLIPHLNKVRIWDIFDPIRANFSGLTYNYRNLCVDGVIQKAIIKVNEEGAETAAASSMGHKSESAPQRSYQFIANRPFVYVLVRKIHFHQRQILFVGVVENPTRT